ncbi:transmembrane protease serine 9 isoform X1 [Halyomorpha halys]|uniref:transmembrane protease serine 9 isoform X1 n=1 Tax=Halyomorpha halys TaxID=286706 RepID=UPI000D0C7920|nr:transmembrane protease serine 9-like isoform X1 [Halyomorpha halys]
MLSIFISFISYGSIAADHQDCGTRYPLNRFKPVISYGSKTLHSEFPWHVAIYKQYSTDESGEYICGGSIIHPKVILTAAHCIYNESHSGIDIANFTVVAGKYHVSWKHTDPGEQRLKVLKIKIPETYVGFTNRYAEDIALLELNTTINYTSAIMPVCIDWSSEYLGEQLPVVGTVVGWGYTENNTTSEELRMANLKVIEFTKCRDRIANGFSFFITSDKFCAGLDNGTAVQSGDSGGGITFPRSMANNQDQYYLYGIVSLKDTGRSNIAVFTDIRKNLPWLNSSFLSITDPGLFEVGCPPFPSNSVALVQCNLNGTSVDCDRDSKLGTKAKLYCKSSYHNGSPFKLYTETECSPGLQWLPLPESCIDCGKRYRFNRIVPVVKYKQRTVSEYPWHVALYRKSDSEGLRLICGATIIHPKAIITVAHLVYDENHKKPVNQTEFLIAVGKFRSSLNTLEPAEQRFQVKKIHIKATYKGVKGRYEDDIAILELNATISLSDYIMPACMDWEGKIDFFRNPHISGTTPGWGKPEDGEKSVELRASKLRHKDKSQCSKLVHGYSKIFLTPDKFCAVSDDGSIPDRGDFGGSLTFPYYDRETGEELNYLHGIISLKETSSDTILLTNVTYHVKWIKTVLVSIIKNSSL